MVRSSKPLLLSNFGRRSSSAESEDDAKMGKEKESYKC